MTAYVKELEEEVLIVWVAIAMPPEGFDFLVDSFDLACRYSIRSMGDDAREAFIQQLSKL